MKPVKRYVLTEGSSLTDDLTGVDPGRCKWVEEGDVVGLVEASDAVLYAAKVIQIDFADSDYYCVPKHILDALRDELARWQS